MNIHEELSKIYNEYKEKYSILGVFLYGSQNYHLQTENSDLDVKMIILPSLEDLVRNSKPISTNIEYEHGLIEIKDIRAYKETLFKMNPSYIEPLFTDYYILNEEHADKWNNIKEIAEDFVYENKFRLAKAIYGMCLEKQKALTHKYPSTVAEIEEIGYSKKQFHHARRLRHFAQSYFIDELSYKDCMEVGKSAMKRLLMEYKLETWKVDIAIKATASAVENCKIIADAQSEQKIFEKKNKMQLLFEEILIDHLKKTL